MENNCYWNKREGTSIGATKINLGDDVGSIVVKLGFESWIEMVKKRIMNCKIQLFSQNYLGKYIPTFKFERELIKMINK